MNWKSPLRLLAPLVGAVLAASFAAAQSDPLKPIATVNGESISGMDYFRRMEFLPGVGRMIRGNYVSTFPGYLALRQLIDETLMLQLAQEKGVPARQSQIDESMKARLEETPNLIEDLKKVGISREDLLRQIRIELAEFNLMTMGITITDQEVERHYKDNPTLFTIPRRYKLRVIAVPDDRKGKVDAEFKANKPFAEVAKLLSTDPSASQGGEMQLLPESAFSELVRVALGKTKIGARTEWIRGETGWFLFHIDDIKPAELRKLDADLKEKVRRSMMVDRGRSRNNVEKMMNEARMKAKVEIVQPGLNEMIQAWLKSPLLDP